MNEEQWAASCLSPWPKASLLLNDQIKSMSSEWLFGGKNGPGPIPCGFLCWPIKHGQLATASQKGQEWPAWKQAPWALPRRVPVPQGAQNLIGTRLDASAICLAPHTFAVLTRTHPQREAGQDPGKTSMDRAVPPFTPFLGIRVKKAPPLRQKGWNSTSFLKTEGPSQASGGFSNIVLFFQCALSLWRGFRRPLKSSALNPC